VVIAFAWGAVISFILAVSPQMQLRGMLFWLMGDLGYARHAGWPLLALAVGVMLCLPLMRQLNVLARGAQQASILGVNTAALQRHIYLLASLFTAVAVTLAGGVGFIGLVVPHMLRLLMGSDHRWLLPASALLGGTLLVLADTAARTWLAPQQLPVGIMTAALGVPLFLYLLHRGQTR
jgi:iron complex transport system permease protein